MQDLILKTKLMEFDKSAFLIELMEHGDSGKKFLKITQTISDSGKPKQKSEIKLNPAILSQVVSVLQDFSQEIEDRFEIQTDRYGHDVEEIKKRYLKGVSLDDLILQFDYTKEQMEQMLKEEGIGISSLDYQPLKKKYFKKRI